MEIEPKRQRRKKKRVDWMYLKYFTWKLFKLKIDDYGQLPTELLNKTKDIEIC